MLKISNFSVATSEGQPLLHNISFELPTQSTSLLIGPNGCGKSTLLQAIMGSQDYITTGHIYWKGQDISSLSIQDRARLKIFLAFQSPVAITGLSLLKLMQYSRTSLAEDADLEGMLQEADLELAKFKKNRDFLTRDLNVSCSGGEKKINEWLQLVLTRPHPELYLLDELDSGLDRDSLGVIQKGLNSRLATKLIVSHSQHHTLDIDQVIILKEGKIAKIGNRSLLKDIMEYGYH